jgi:TolA-binding protein
MKTNFIHTMAIVVLATSISAFAQTGDTKRESQATTSNTAQQNDSNQEASNPMASNVSMSLDQLQKQVQQLDAMDKKNQQEEQKAKQERNKQLRQDEKQWEHSLLGVYGG